MSIHEIRENAEAQMRTLAATAKAENRNLTAVEMVAWQDAEAKVRDMNGRARAADDLQHRQSAAGFNTTPSFGDVAPQSILDDPAFVAARARGNYGANRVTERALYGPKGSGQRSWLQDVVDAKSGSIEARTYLEVDARENRTYSAATTTEGGYLVAPAYLQAQYGEYLRAKTPVLSIVNAQQHPGSRTLYLPKQDGATAVARFAENATLTETAATVAQVSATNFRAGGLATLSGELFDFSDPSVEMMVTNDLIRALGILQETWVLEGTGSSQPTGIKGTSGIGSVTYTAGTATAIGLWAAIVKTIQTVDTAYFSRPSHIVMSPRRFAWLVGQGDGSNRPIATSVSQQNSMATGSSFEDAALTVNSILGIPIVLSNNMGLVNGAGTDEDYILVGDFAEAHLWTGSMVVDVDHSSGFAKDQVLVRAKVDTMFTAARHPEAFAKLTGTGLNDTL